MQTLPQLDAWIDTHAHETISAADRLRMAVAVIDRAVEMRSPRADLSTEDIFDRHERLSRELAGEAIDPARASAIRMELDCLRPKIAAKLRAAEEFRRAWPGCDIP